jgi:hypothetical protein
MQIGFVAERVRPHEAQEDQLGRWVGVEFEKVSAKKEERRWNLNFVCLLGPRSCGEGILVHSISSVSKCGC